MAGYDGTSTGGPSRRPSRRYRRRCRRHQAAQRQAEANLSRDQAQLENAKVEEERYRRLVAGGFVAREQYDQFLTGLKTAEATIEADQAAVATAKALIRADEAMVETAKLKPGLHGDQVADRRADGQPHAARGNVVRSGGTTDSTLLVINQIQPIYVSFTVPQQQLPAIKDLHAGRDAASRGGADGRAEGGAAAS